MTAKPFTSARQWHDWQVRNCDKCALRGTVPGADCELHAAVSAAMQNGGEVEVLVAGRIGWWDVPSWSWTCGEIEKRNGPAAMERPSYANLRARQKEGR